MNLPDDNVEAIQSNKTKTNPDDTFEYVTILDSTGAYLLSNDNDGNFNLQLSCEQDDSGISFATYHKVVVGDDSDWIMQYYPETMKKFGVSRFRMSSDQVLPESSDIVTLAPLDYDGSTDTHGVYLAVSTTGDFFYPVVCNINDQVSKIFLVEDPVKGLERLKNKDLRYIITGGVVSEFFYMAFVSEYYGF
jgi:hypothetical protein